MSTTRLLSNSNPIVKIDDSIPKGKKLSQILIAAAMFIVVIGFYFHIPGQVRRQRAITNITTKNFVWPPDLDLALDAIVDNPEKDYVLFKFLNETRAIKRLAIATQITQLENGARVETYTPVNVTEFFWRWKRGRFLECHKEEVVGRKKFTKNIPDSFATTLSELQDFMADYGAAPFLMFGSLLGWRRECSFIPHDDDVDLGIFVDEYSDELINAFKNSWNFRLIYTLGKLNDSFEFCLHTGIVGLTKRRIDIYLVYEDKTNNISHASSHDSEDEQPKNLQANYPVISEICSVDFLNHLFYVPCNVDAVVEADYGPDWRYDIETTEFSHTNVSLYSNVKVVEVYSKEEFWNDLIHYNSWV